MMDLLAILTEAIRRGFTIKIEPYVRNGENRCACWMSKGEQQWAKDVSSVEEQKIADALSKIPAVWERMPQPSHNSGTP